MANMPRRLTRSEVKTGRAVHEQLADKVQHHAGNCGCPLCVAWLTLCSVDVYGEDVLCRVERVKRRQMKLHVVNPQ